MLEIHKRARMKTCIKVQTIWVGKRKPEKYPLKYIKAAAAASIYIYVCTPLVKKYI